jgi:protein-disulfide isomerase
MKHDSAERSEFTQRRASRAARRARLGGAVAAALLAGVSACHDGGPQPEEEVSAAHEALSVYSGIAQRGAELGSPDARVTVTEFSDLRCSHCRDFALNVLPEIVERYVRTNKVKVVFRNLAFLGPSSVRLARSAAAVGMQGQLYQFVDAYFRLQAQPGHLTVDDDLVRRLAGGLPGVDVDRAMSQRSSAAVDEQLAKAKEEAERFGIRGTPMFLVGRTGETPRVVRLTSMAEAALTKAIDPLL